MFFSSCVPDDWTPQQKHAAQTFLDNYNARRIAYQISDAAQRMQLLWDIIAEHFIQKRNKDIELILPWNYCKDSVWKYLRQKTRHCKHIWRGKLRIHSDYTSLNISTLSTQQSRFARSSMVLVLAEEFDPPLEIWRNLLALVNRDYCQALITYSNINVETKHVLAIGFKFHEELYPKVTHQAMYIWLLCAKKMRMDKNIARLIAEWIWCTRTDTSWVHLET